jgi:hypothetical protein
MPVAPVQATQRKRRRSVNFRRFFVALKSHSSLNVKCKFNSAASAGSNILDPRLAVFFLPISGRNQAKIAPDGESSHHTALGALALQFRPRQSGCDLAHSHCDSRVRRLPAVHTVRVPEHRSLLVREFLARPLAPPIAAVRCLAACWFGRLPVKTLVIAGVLARSVVSCCSWRVLLFLSCFALKKV